MQDRKKISVLIGAAPRGPVYGVSRYTRPGAAFHAFHG
jgi:hypothetical protein